MDLFLSVERLVGVFVFMVVFVLYGKRFLETIKKADLGAGAYA